MRGIARAEGLKAAKLATKAVAEVHGSRLAELEKRIEQLEAQGKVRPIRSAA